MTDEQRPHTGLKGAKVTSDIQEQISFTDANKTIGGYMDEESCAENDIAKAGQLPRFSSTIQIDKQADFSRKDKAENIDSSSDDQKNTKNYETDDDEFFYGDYISTTKTTADETQVIVDSKTGIRGREATRLNTDSIHTLRQPDQIFQEENIVGKSFSDRKRRRSNDSSSSAPSSRSVSPVRSIGSPEPKKSNVTSKGGIQPVEVDEDEEFFNELAREAKRFTSTAKERTPEASNRIFNIKFQSRLEGSIDKKINVRVKGKHAFTRILPAALKTMMKEYAIPNSLQQLYTTDLVTLYRNGVKVLNFMNCNSLQIPQNYENEISDVLLTMVSKNAERSYELEYEQKNYGDQIITIMSENDSPTDANDLTIPEYEKELINAQEHDPTTVNRSEEIETQNPENDTIKISLMGQDNKKIFVNVRSGTSFSKIAQHYKQAKGLSSTTELQLKFDNEVLNLDWRIMDVDIENEDIIDVVII